jgi:hypothetical protein
MPVHDWTRVDAGIFHDFHHAWIEELKRELNGGLLPGDYYALAEQHAAGFGPDVLTLEARTDEAENESRSPTPAEPGGVSLLLSPPRAEIVAETDIEFYRRKQNAVVVRHVSDDRMVAVIEVVSPGNKAGRRLRSFVGNAAELLDHRIHMLILDLVPRTSHNPQGIHGAIWEEITGQDYAAPAGKPLTLAAYESGLTVRGYVEPLSVGSALADMPLFLEPGAHVLLPLEATYQRAFAVLPRRWRVVLEKSA